MSFIVGFNLNHYLVLGADTRISYYPNNRLLYRDDETKIRTTSVGLITGAGLCDLLDPVKDRMAADEPPHTDAMRQIIREECVRAQLHFANHPDKRVHEALQTTGWMLTYITNSEQYFPAGLRVAVMGSSGKDNLFNLCLPGKATFLPFSGITKDQHAELMQMAEAGLRPWEQGKETLAENVVHHVSIIGRIIGRAAEMSEMVSPTFQIGIQTIFYDIGISNIFDVNNPDGFSISWRPNPDSVQGNE